jgi:hypothetical protein
MQHDFKMLAVAAAVLAFPIFTCSQASAGQASPSVPGAQAPTGHREAMRMVPVRAELMRPLDAQKDQAGSAVQAKLVQKVTLSNGVELPSGTVLAGKVTADDMQHQGKSKLALRFDQAELKDGKKVPIKATIVGFYGPGSTTTDSFTGSGDQVPNSWNDGTLQMDQIDVLGGVDLHSKISSRNSGVFVSTKKDNFKLEDGSEIQFAIGPGRMHAAAMNQ